MESWYRYRARNELKESKSKNYTGNMGYNEFIESYMAVDKQQPHASLQTQYDFIRLDNGKIGVDRIIPMDRIDLVSDFIFERTGNRIKLPHKNRSPRKRFELTLDKELEENCANIYAMILHCTTWRNITRPLLQHYMQKNSPPLDLPE